MLREFLAQLPGQTAAAFEFRHESWLDDEVYGALRERGVALCIADSETRSTPVVTTAEYVYFRLRDEGYSDADLVKWSGVVSELGRTASDVFVYFKHEDAGKGAAFGQRLIELLGNPA